MGWHCQVSLQMISYLVLATGLAHHLVDEAQRQSGVVEELLSLKARAIARPPYIGRVSALSLLCHWSVPKG